MSGHRQAALALHGLTGGDRDAILIALPAAEQATLRGYLDELDVLGFHSDGSEYAAMQATPVRLETAPAGMLFSVLEHEPAALVAQVLALQDWPWSAALLALYPAARRELIRTAGAGGAHRPAPALERFLRAELDARLARLAPAHGDAAAPMAAVATRKWWRPWRR